MSPNTYIYTYMHIRIFRMSICTVAFAYQCPIVLAFQYYPRRNACVCEHWKFCFDCKDWSLHSTSIWLLSPYKTLGSASLIAAPCEPDRPTWDSDPTMIWGRMCFASVFMLPFGFSKSILVRQLVLSSLVHRPQRNVFRPTCCMAFWTWTSLWILPVMRPRDDNPQDIGSSGIRDAWRATLTWNLRKQINRNL